MKPQTEKGQVLILSTIILMFLIITIAAFQYYLSVQTKHTVESAKQTLAFNIAYAGVEQAVWKLNSEPQGWENALKGIIPCGYKGDKTYTHMIKKGDKDVIAGYYKIKITTEPYRVIINSIGCDETKSEVEGLRVIYELAVLENAITYEGGKRIEIKGDTEIHWAPIISKYSNIKLSGDAKRLWFPRKRAGRGFVVLCEEEGLDERDSAKGAGIPPDHGYTRVSYTGPPNDIEYAEWRSNVDDLPDVTFDLNVYRERAKRYIMPADMVSRLEFDPNKIEHWHDEFNRPTGYFRKRPGVGKATLKFGRGKGEHERFIDITCSTITYFIDSPNPTELDVEIRENSFIGPPDGTVVDNKVAFICIGDLKIEGKGGITNYKVIVPDDAEKEYKNGTVRNSRRGDTSAPNEYPGDAGLNAAQFFEFKIGQQIYDEIDKEWKKYEYVNFCGFLYVAGTLVIKGDEIFVGCMFVEGRLEKTEVGKRAKIFYNSNVARSIKYGKISFTKKKWETKSFGGSFDKPVW